MRSSLMTLGLLLFASGVANAQMGPAGPGGGSYSGGAVQAWAGTSQVTNIPSGTSVTFTFVPTVSGLPIYRIEYKDAYSGVVLSNTGTTCTIQPGQSGTLNVVATAYDWFGSIVDVATTPLSVTWEPPYELKFYHNNGISFKVVDRFGNEMGPGAQYQIQGTWIWDWYGEVATAFGGIGNSFPTLSGPDFAAPWTITTGVHAWLYTRPNDSSSRSCELDMTYRFSYPTFNGYSVTTGYSNIQFTYLASWANSAPGDPPAITIFGPGE